MEQPRGEMQAAPRSPHSIPLHHPWRPTVLHYLLSPHPVGDAFGVGSFVTQRSGSVAPLAVGRVQLLGAGWVREEFTACRLHSGPNARYQWSSYDRVIDAERRAGLQVLGLLDYNNTWRYGNHADMPHRDIARLSAEFSRYAYAVVRHYRGRIRYWQVWNEPDLTLFWRPRPNPADYATLLSAAYRAIKRADPHARVVLAGISGVDLTFLRQLVKHTHSFDVLAVHPYRTTPEGELVNQIHTLRSLHRPIWFSEIGWAAGPGCPLCRDSNTQAEYLVRFYSLALAAGVQRIFWYDLRDDAQERSSPEAHFGLLHRDLSGKPAFATYEVLAHELRMASFLAADDLGEDGAYVLRFQSARGPVAIAWNVDDTDHEVHLPWPASSAVVLNLSGEPRGNAQVSAGQAAWTIPSGGEPEYLVSDPAGMSVTPPGALLHGPRRVVRLHPPAPQQRRPGAHRPARPGASPAARRRAIRRAHHPAPNRAAWAAPRARPTPPSIPRRKRERALPVRPTPTVTPTPAPTPSPTPTPILSTPTPTPTPTDILSRPAPSPTNTPTATPTVQTSPTAEPTATPSGP